MPVYTKQGGSWVPFKPRVKINGAWVNVRKAYVKINGTWRTVFSLDPVSQLFLTSGTYTIPEGATRLVVEGLHGGAAGSEQIRRTGGSNPGLFAGSGGGGGGSYRKEYRGTEFTNLGRSVSVVIGGGSQPNRGGGTVPAGGSTTFNGESTGGGGRSYRSGFAGPRGLAGIGGFSGANGQAPVALGLTLEVNERSTVGRGGGGAGTTGSGRSTQVDGAGILSPGRGRGGNGSSVPYGQGVQNVRSQAGSSGALRVTAHFD